MKTDYTALSFTITCEVTGFTASNTPSSSFAYSIFSGTQVFSLNAVTYVQSPACGYTFTNTFGHTITGTVAQSIISAGTTLTPSFQIKSTTPSHEASYTVKLTNSITIGANQGQGSTTTFTPADVTVTIVVTDPCKTTTLTPITFNPTSISVDNGNIGSAEFSPPADGVDTANSLKLLCGPRAYAVVDNADNSSVAAWVSIVDSTTTTGDKTLKITTLNYPTAITTASVSRTIKVTTTLTNYSGATASTQTIVVTINSVTCSCAAMAWTQPTI